MASLVRNAKSGYFYAQFFDSRKRPRRKTVPLRTSDKRTAGRALARIENAVALGEFDPWAAPIPETEPLARLGEAVTAYLDSCRQLKPDTQRTYREICSLFERYAGPSLPISRITAGHIERWLDSTSAGDVTRRKYVKHLGYLFRFLMRRGDLDQDISKKVMLRRIPERRPKAMTVQECERLTSTIRDYSSGPASRHSFEWLADLIDANVHLGLRRGELIHLEWDQVYFDRRILMVSNSSDFTTKSLKERTLPLSPQAYAALMRQLRRKSGPHVFHIAGKRLKPTTLTHQFRRFRILAGLGSHIHFHSTRHTFATWLAEKGVPVTVIQNLMGHSTVTTTERYMSSRADVASYWIFETWGFDLDPPSPPMSAPDYV